MPFFQTSSATGGRGVLSDENRVIFHWRPQPIPVNLFMHSEKGFFCIKNKNKPIKQLK